MGLQTSIEAWLHLLPLRVRSDTAIDGVCQPGSSSKLDRIVEGFDSTIPLPEIEQSEEYRYWIHVRRSSGRSYRPRGVKPPLPTSSVDDTQVVRSPFMYTI